MRPAATAGVPPISPPADAADGWLVAVVAELKAVVVVGCGGLAIF